MRGHLHCLCSGETLVGGKKSCLQDAEMCESWKGIQSRAGGGSMEWEGGEGGVWDSWVLRMDIMLQVRTCMAQLCTIRCFVMTKAYKGGRPSEGQMLPQGPEGKHPHVLDFFGKRAQKKNTFQDLTGLDQIKWLISRRDSGFFFFLT